MEEDGILSGLLEGGATIFGVQPTENVKTPFLGYSIRVQTVGVRINGYPNRTKVSHISLAQRRRANREKRIDLLTEHHNNDNQSHTVVSRIQPTSLRQIIRQELQKKGNPICVALARNRQKIGGFMRNSISRLQKNSNE